MMIEAASVRAMNPSFTARFSFGADAVVAGATVVAALDDAAAVVVDGGAAVVGGAAAGLAVVVSAPHAANAAAAPDAPAAAPIRFRKSRLCMTQTVRTESLHSVSSKRTGGYKNLTSLDR
jgi:hypothetical protein